MPALALYSADGSEQHLPARLLHREPGLYRLCVPAAIETGCRLVMVEGEYRFEVAVQSCQPFEESGFVVECRVISCREGTIRQEWRMPVNIRARMTVPLTGASFPARIRNMSPFGMGVEIATELVMGTAVVVHTRDGFGYGEVRHCHKGATEHFLVGLYLREYIANPGSFGHDRLHSPLGRWLRVLGKRWRKGS